MSKAPYTKNYAVPSTRERLRQPLRGVNLALSLQPYKFTEPRDRSTPGTYYTYRCYHPGDDYGNRLIIRTTETVTETDKETVQEVACCTWDEKAGVEVEWFPINGSAYNPE